MILQSRANFSFFSALYLSHSREREKDNAIVKVAFIHNTFLRHHLHYFFLFWNVVFVRTELLFISATFFNRLICKCNFCEFVFLKIVIKKILFSKQTKIFFKKSLFYYKIGLIKLPFIAKVMENQNFKRVYLRTMILCL